MDKITDAEYSKIVKLLKEKRHSPEVARIVGKEHSLVWHIAKENNIKLKGLHLTKEEESQIFRLLNKWKTVAEISRFLKRSESCISNFKRACGFRMGTVSVREKKRIVRLMNPHP